MPGAVGYARVSTAEQAVGNNSLSVQQRKLQDYCNAHGLTLLKVFVDPGESARTTASNFEWYQTLDNIAGQVQSQNHHAVQSRMPHYKRVRK